MRNIHLHFKYCYCHLIFYGNELINLLLFCRCLAYEKETVHCKENHSESEIIIGALSALQDKNTHLENSLSAETRIKLDLFSALGEAKRQLEIKESKYALSLLNKKMISYIFS